MKQEEYYDRMFMKKINNEILSKRQGFSGRISGLHREGSNYEECSNSILKERENYDSNKNHDRRDHIDGAYGSGAYEKYLDLRKKYKCLTQETK